MLVEDYWQIDNGRQLDRFLIALYSSVGFDRGVPDETLNSVLGKIEALKIAHPGEGITTPEPTCPRGVQ